LLPGPFPLLVPVITVLAAIENNNGLPSLIQTAKQELKNYEVVASAQIPALPAPAATEPPKKDPPPQVLPLADLAQAHAAFEKLKLHIDANRIYYVNNIWKCEDPNARFERLKIKGIHNYVENRLLGFAGSKAAYPLRVETLEPAVRKHLEKNIANFDPDKIDTHDGVDYDPVKASKSDVALPTPALYMEALLGQCDALEPFLVDHRKIDTDKALAELAIQREKLKQEQQETARLRARLAAVPPVLDDPHPPAPQP
jgi:hypothetical protein